MVFIYTTYILHDFYLNEIYKKQKNKQPKSFSIVSRNLIIGNKIGALDERKCHGRKKNILVEREVYGLVKIHTKCFHCFI